MLVFDFALLCWLLIMTRVGMYVMPPAIFIQGNKILYGNNQVQSSVEKGWLWWKMDHDKSKQISSSKERVVKPDVDL